MQYHKGDFVCIVKDFIPLQFVIVDYGITCWGDTSYHLQRGDDFRYATVNEFLSREEAMSLAITSIIKHVEAECKIGKDV